MASTRRSDSDVCGCGDDKCMHFAVDYPLCPACQDHHRHWHHCPGVDEDGNDVDGIPDFDLTATGESA